MSATQRIEQYWEENIYRYCCRLKRGRIDIFPLKHMKLEFKSWFDPAALSSIHVSIDYYACVDLRWLTQVAFVRPATVSSNSLPSLGPRLDRLQVTTQPPVTASRHQIIHVPPPPLPSDPLCSIWSEYRAYSCNDRTNRRNIGCRISSDSDNSQSNGSAHTDCAENFGLRWGISPSSPDVFTGEIAALSLEH